MHPTSRETWNFIIIILVSPPSKKSRSTSCQIINIHFTLNMFKKVIKNNKLRKKILWNLYNEVKIEYYLERIEKRVFKSSETSTLKTNIKYNFFISVKTNQHTAK